MLTRFFKLANCSNFDPAQLLAEKRTAEMPQSDFEELVDFSGVQAMPSKTLKISPVLTCTGGLTGHPRPQNIEVNYILCFLHISHIFQMQSNYK